MTAALFLAALIGTILAYRALVQRIERLEDEVAALRGDARWANADEVAAPAAERMPALVLPTVVEPVAPAVPSRDAPPSRGRGFEQLVGGRLPIWVGGAALAIAGFYLVALAIEAGLLDPPVRVALAMLFGGALIAAAELAGRWPPLAADARVAQALAGAGVASLYAAAYLASAIYGLVPAAAAIALMALVTALALGLALRWGAPTAIMGLLGGFAAPLLATGGTAVLPLLGYLGLLSAGLFALAIRRGWVWLALATMAGSFLWLAALVARDASLAAGGFVLAFAGAAAFAAPAAARRMSAGRRTLLRGAPIAVGLVELAGLIPASRFGIEGWGLYLALSAGTIVLAWRDARLTPLVVGALALALAALVAATGAWRAALPIAGAAGVTLLFGAAGHVLGRRPADGWLWAAIGAAALIAPFGLLRGDRGLLLPAQAWGALALLLAAAPLHLAWRGRGAGRPLDRALQIAAAAAALLVALAAADLLPWRLFPTVLAAIAVALAAAGWRTGDEGLGVQGAVAAGIAWLWMFMRGAGVIGALLLSLGGARVLLPTLPPAGEAAATFLPPALLLAVAAWRVGAGGARRAMLAAAATALAAGAYVLAKQPLAIRDEAAFVARGFVERAILTQALFAGAWLIGRRWPTAARAVAALAVARLVWFDLLALNPAWVAQDVGEWPVANLLTLHFGLAACWIAPAWRGADARERRAWLAGLVAILLGGALLVARQMFHPAAMAAGPVSRGELYAYSVAGLAVALGLLGWGARGRDGAMRIAGLGLLTLVTLKVFLVDAAALTGALRAVSFLGLGVALIGIGWGYGRFAGRAPPPPGEPFSG